MNTLCKFMNKFCTTKTINVDTNIISKFQLKNFSDRVRLTVNAGKGGNGSNSYFTSKTVRRGAPDGGCGGRGGDIIIEAHTSLHDLSHLRRRIISGNNGGDGGPNGKDGKNGGKTILRVPCGTLVFEIQSQDTTEQRTFLADLDLSNKQYVSVEGGQAGKGSKVYPFINQQLRMGKLGKDKIIQLQLKTLADVGLVGFPNIGKSTFLAAVSRALPKIANYAFTTLKPSVGYVKFVDNFKLTVADIPGIIQDAHKDKGLGLQFLKHIERTKILLFVLDITSEDPLGQLQKLQNELRQYKKDLFEGKHKIVALNKMDCLQESKCLQRFEDLQKKIQYPSFLISAKEGTNLGQVLIQIRKKLQQMKLKQEQEQKE